MTLIEARGVSAGYGNGGKDILNDLSFTLHSSEKLCVAGPNGCGKTTLLRVLAGTLPYRGSILITVTDPDSPLAGQTIERRNLKGRAGAREGAMLSQLASPSFPFTVSETVMLGRYARQKKGWAAIPSATDRQAAEEAMRVCGIADLADETIGTLSGGQLQRVFLARTLTQDPSMLLLDEPTNHLDLFYQLGLLSLIDTWMMGGIPASQKDASQNAATQNPEIRNNPRVRAAIGVFHDLNLALRFADTMLLLKKGEIAAYGPAETVIRGPEIAKVYGLDVQAAMRALLQNWQKSVIVKE